MDTKHTTPLTTREIATARMLAQGMTQKMIARRDRVSPDAVKQRVSGLLFKTKARNAAEAIYIATKQGLIGIAIGAVIVASVHGVDAPRARRAPRPVTVKEARA